MASPPSAPSCTDRAPEGQAGDISAPDSRDPPSPSKTYEKVVVLLICWEKGRKSFKRDLWLLDLLFGGRFDFEVRRAELPSGDAEAKAELSSHSCRLLRDDEPTTLFIIAYSGHAGRSSARVGARHDLCWAE